MLWMSIVECLEYLQGDVRKDTANFKADMRQILAEFIIVTDAELMLNCK